MVVLDLFSEWFVSVRRGAEECLVIGACEGVDGLQWITYDNNPSACPFQL